MTTTWPIPFNPFFLPLLHSLSHRLEAAFRRLIHPHPDSLVRGTLADLTCTKAELIAENALLRHQLAILHRQVKRPTLNRRERFGLFLLSKSRARVEKGPAHYPTRHPPALASHGIPPVLEVEIA